MTLVDDLDRFLGGFDQATEEQAEAVVEMVTAFARAYTRGRGFTDGDPNEAVSAVIVTASARLFRNTGSIRSHTLEDFSVDFDVFRGFNLVETLVLNNYRKTAY